MPRTRVTTIVSAAVVPRQSAAGSSQIAPPSSNRLSASAGSRTTQDLAAAATPASSVSASTGSVDDGLFRPGAAQSFAAFLASHPGVSIAAEAVNGGASQTFGADDAAHGWSTTKVPVLVALLKARGASGLTSAESVEAESAITVSDNTAVLALFSDLESLEGGFDGANAAIDALFTASGSSTQVATSTSLPPGAVTTFGQTLWSPSEAVKFYRSLAGGCLLPTESTSYVLGLMEHVTSSGELGAGQRWVRLGGLARVAGDPSQTGISCGSRG